MRGRNQVSGGFFFQFGREGAPCYTEDKEHGCGFRSPKYHLLSDFYGELLIDYDLIKINRKMVDDLRNGGGGLLWKAIVNL